MKIERPGDGLRRDARENRERLVASAVKVIASDGLNVPLATIAAEAGVGVATLYRSFADRDALMQELELRAYDEIDRILRRIEDAGMTGLPAVHRFLVDTLAVADRLILPLHGAPPLVDGTATAARDRIDAALEAFLQQGRESAAIASDANATDVIMCSALITQPLRHGPDWQRTALRHIAIFTAGLASGRALPGPPVGREDLERTWVERAGLRQVR